MALILILYTVCVLATLIVYYKWYQNTVPVYEIALCWYVHLPAMVIQHYKHKKAENELIQRRAEIWSKCFQEALKISNEENWSKEDWSRWNENVEYSLTLIR